MTEVDWTPLRPRWNVPPNQAHPAVAPARTTTRPPAALAGAFRTSPGRTLALCVSGGDQTRHALEERAGAAKSAGGPARDRSWARSGECALTCLPVRGRAGAYASALVLAHHTAGCAARAGEVDARTCTMGGLSAHHTLTRSNAILRWCIGKNGIHPSRYLGPQYPVFRWTAPLETQHLPIPSRPQHP